MGEAIDVCLLSCMYICLGFADIPHYGEYETLLELFVLSEVLYKDDYQKEAYLCLRILAFLSIKTNQIPSSLKDHALHRLPERLVAVFVDSCELAHREENWVPGELNEDPWRYMIT